MSVCVVHLLWGPLDVGPIARFAASYAAHPAGLDHRLLVMFNGFRTAGARDRARQALQGLRYDELHLDAPVLDLAGYAVAVREAVDDHLVFLNSYSEPLADGWLEKLMRHLLLPGVGLVGASGSWESAASAAPLYLRLPHRLLFPSFPNPHVRTNAFALPRTLALKLRWPRVRRKREALMLENGRRSLTRQVTARGLAAVVVGRDGRAYGPEEWPASATFRSGGQANLLVADNRTRQFETAGDGAAKLAHMAWGARAA